MTRAVIVEADGGSRGNPGPAGYGAVVRDADTGEVLREVAAGIGVASNNVAEYRGLIAGLEAALELGADEVDVRMDSLLVVNQMSEKWRIKHEAMRPLASQAATLVRRLGTVRFTHIPRELNKHADRLANEAMDAAAAGRTWMARADSGRSMPGASGGAAERVRATGRARAAPPSGSGWSAPTGARTRLLLLRHGETALSPQRRFSGRGDPPLTGRGQAQAQAAAERLAEMDLDAVVSSPLQRAVQTAQSVARAAGVEVAVNDDVVETDFGEWEGLTFAEIRDRWPSELQAWQRNPDVAPPGGESFTATAARVVRAREALLAAYAGATVAVVSHVTPIKTMVRQALEAPVDALYRIHLDPASLSIVDWWAAGGAMVRLLNDTSHLGPSTATFPR